MTKHQALKDLEVLEAAAYQALLDDPAVKADIAANHTPALMEAWNDICAKCYAYREQHKLIGMTWHQIEKLD